MISKNNRLVGAILLVSGTTIGAGMLALPVTTGLAGFIPSILIMTFIWLYMMLTAFYLLEVNLLLPHHNNLISMMHKTLGKPGEIASWISYLLLLYSLLAAYMVGCGQILSDALFELFNFSTPTWVWQLVVFFIFGSFIYLGTSVVDFLNRFLMFGLLIAYICMVSFGCCNVRPSFLYHLDWKFLLPSISVVLTTFGYHIIIPTLSEYLDQDRKLIKKAIIIGSLVPFLIYILWQFLVMGTVPAQGNGSLFDAANNNTPIVSFLQSMISNPFVAISARFFAFFAIVTSLLGVCLSLSDFLADGLRIKKTSLGKCFLISLTFVPPLLFSIFYQKGFILALKYAGFFVVILLALLPSLMVFFERYVRERLKKGTHFTVFGGKSLVVLSIITSLILLILVCL